MEKIEIIGELDFYDGEKKKHYYVPVWGSWQNPLFRAVDIARTIDFSNGRTDAMVEDLESYLKLLIPWDKLLFPTNTGDQKRGGLHRDSWFLTEYGLYEVLMRSRKPIAKRFKLEVYQILHSARQKNNWSFEDFLTGNKDRVYYDKKKKRLMTTTKVCGEIVNIYLYDGTIDWVYEDGTIVSPED